VNKAFLANTIRSVESHNRREETEDCWRQHDLMKKRIRRSDDSENDEDGDGFEDTRNKWAKKKVQGLSYSDKRRISCLLSSS
jgi:hypothetical protein